MTRQIQIIDICEQKAFNKACMLTKGDYSPLEVGSKNCKQTWAALLSSGSYVCSDFLRAGLLCQLISVDSCDALGIQSLPVQEPKQVRLPAIHCNNQRRLANFYRTTLNTYRPYRATRTSLRNHLAHQPPTPWFISERQSRSIRTCSHQCGPCGPTYNGSQHGG